MNCNFPHKRLNLLNNEWVLVSPHRTQRPWLGKEEEVNKTEPIAYDPKCYLCPGNLRAGGAVTPKYEGTYVFDNDYAALLPRKEDEKGESFNSKYAWMQAEREDGICRVICYSGNHSKLIKDMTLPEVETVIHVWQAQLKDLESVPYINYVQIFENRGSIMGCSNPHPHGQIWATHGIPNEVKKEDAGQANYLEKNQECLLCDVLSGELECQERIIFDNEDWVVLVPYWAIWPFETMMLPKRHIASLHDLSEREVSNLAITWTSLLKVYDKLFGVMMPFSFGWHLAPKNTQNREAWHLHAHFYPPLLRSATVKKFMVGYEMLGNAQRDITPEKAAERLRECL